MLAAVQKAVAAITDHMGLSPLAQDDPVLAFYFEALHFMRLAEQFGPHALFDVTVSAPGAAGAKTPPSTLCVRNVIPAPYLAGRYAAAHATVLFSGTFSPQQFYRDTLGLPAAAADRRGRPVPGRAAGGCGGGHVSTLSRLTASARSRPSRT